MKLFNNDLIYPPHKLKDIENKNGVRWNIKLLKDTLLAKHLFKINGKIIWRRITKNEPLEGIEVYTKIDDGNEERNVQKLTREGNLWFTGGTYVYHTPTHFSYNK